MIKRILDLRFWRLCKHSICAMIILIIWHLGVKKIIKEKMKVIYSKSQLYDVGEYPITQFHFGIVCTGHNSIGLTIFLI